MLYAGALCAMSWNCHKNVFFFFAFLLNALSCCRSRFSSLPLPVKKNMTHNRYKSSLNFFISYQWMSSVVVVVSFYYVLSTAALRQQRRELQMGIAWTIASKHVHEKLVIMVVYAFASFFPHFFCVALILLGKMKRIHNGNLCNFSRSLQVHARTHSWHSLRFIFIRWLVSLFIFCCCCCIVYVVGNKVLIARSLVSTGGGTFRLLFIIMNFNSSLRSHSLFDFHDFFSSHILLRQCIRCSTLCDQEYAEMNWPDPKKNYIEILFIFLFFFLRHCVKVDLSVTRRIVIKIDGRPPHMLCWLRDGNIEFVVPIQLDSLTI